MRCMIGEASGADRMGPLRRLYVLTPWKGGLGQHGTGGATAVTGGRRKPRRGDGSAEYSAGDRVRHAKFGEGTVVAVARGGNDWVITVAFPGGGGIKHLAQSFAPMERI